MIGGWVIDAGLGETVAGKLDHILVRAAGHRPVEDSSWAAVAFPNSLTIGGEELGKPAAGLVSLGLAAKFCDDRGGVG